MRNMFEIQSKSKKSNSQDFKDIESLIDNWSKPAIKKGIPKVIRNVSKHCREPYLKSLNPFEIGDIEDLKNLNPFETDDDEDVKSLNPFEIDDDEDDVEDNEPTDYSNPFEAQTMKEEKTTLMGIDNPFVDELNKDNSFLFSDQHDTKTGVNTANCREDIEQESLSENKSLSTQKCSTFLNSVAAFSRETEHRVSATHTLDSIRRQSNESMSLDATGGPSDCAGDDAVHTTHSQNANTSGSKEANNSSQSTSLYAHQVGVSLFPEQNNIPFRSEDPSHPPLEKINSSSPTAYPPSSMLYHREDSLQDSFDKDGEDSLGHIFGKQGSREISPEAQGNHGVSAIQEVDIAAISSFIKPDATEILQNHSDKNCEEHSTRSPKYENDQGKIQRLAALSELTLTDGPVQNIKFVNDNVRSPQNTNDKNGSENCGNPKVKPLGESSADVASSSSTSNSNIDPINDDVVLVTGGNGFLGQHLVKMLHLKAPHVKEIRILDKTPFIQKLDYETTKPIKILTGNITDSDFVKSSIKGVNSVLHIAGLVSFGTFPDIEGMKQVNVNGTLNIVNACLAEESVSRLVYCSTVDVVVGHNPIRGGDEDNTPVPKDFLFPGYPETKNQGERLVLGASICQRSHGSPRLQTLALRANVMYGELDPYYVTSGLKMAKQRSGVLTQIGDGSAMFQQAYVGNTAWAFVCADRTLKEEPNLTSKFFYVPDRTPIQNSFNFMRPYLEARGFQLSSNPVSYNLVYGAICAAEKVAKLVSPLKRLNLPTQSCSLAYINMDLYFKGDKARDILKYEPLFSPVEARLLSMDYYNKVRL